MKYSIYFLFMTALILFSCSKGSLLNEDLGHDFNTVGLESSGIIHRVSAGGNDACEAIGLANGCDKSFSLTAIMKADGSVSGQWIDGYGKNAEGEQIGGIHVNIDCLYVDGNFATFSGFITKGSINGFDVSGQYAYGAVLDNGTSSKDTPDQITGSYRTGNQFDCASQPREDWKSYNFFDLTTGQVTVK